ncbi:ABC transporter permease [Sphingobacterium sp. JB170]|uniref:ABC transporter permease n=1 Tax=Sphingobacterium sp. JB170 TaxID=1434842 RepID=UPI00097F22E5|nr:ABC transporter permease [Sphingobacterium sp. JB170]SJN23530.1 putative ABC transporter permease [Sphingobacterium sp. JB170]
MLKSYIKFGLRAVTSDKKSSLLHIVGLSISLASVILISLWINDELSFNTAFSKYSRTYQATAQFDKHSEKFNYTVPAPIATIGKTEIPAIEDACRIFKSAKIAFSNGQLRYDESGIYADNSFFNLFDLPSKFIDTEKPFSSHRSIVITKSLADKYFGTQDPLGQTIELQLDWILQTKTEPFVVSGVIDNFPENSSLNGDFILPIALLKNIRGNDFDMQWGNFQYQVYFLLSKDSDPQAVSNQLTNMQKKRFQDVDGTAANEGLYRNFSYFLQPISDVNLYSPTGKDKGMQLIYTFCGIGLAILLIASVNYVNLVTAKTTKRRKEITLRKIAGAKKTDLFFQYVAESGTIFLIALLIAIVLAYLFIPLFNDLSGKNLTMDLRSKNIYLIFAITFFTTFVFAGIYPAILFSRNKPTSLFQTNTTSFGNKNNLRKLLVVLQFSFTVVLIISTITFGRQLHFMRKMDLGYDKENVFLFEQKNFLARYDAIRDELEKQPGILGVTAASSDLSNFGSETADINWEGKSIDQINFFITQVSIDRNFTEVMDIPLNQGIGFTGTAADSNHVILNETAIKEMGIKNPIGKTIDFHQRKFTITGITKDFNFNDLKTEIKPCILFMGMGFALGGMYVRTAPDKADIAIEAVEKLWSKYNPETEFNYFFLDDAFDRLYKEDIVSAQLVTIFSVLAILLSCMGLAGLIVFTTETKLKEIGIRKTLGASVNSIVLLIVKEYMAPVFIAILVAFPVAWLIVSKWLENYVYRTPVDGWIFILSGVVTIILVFLTAARISIKAAKTNPVNILRNE